MPVPISIAVEGVADEAVVRRLLKHVGGETGTVYGKAGKAFLRDRIGGYVSAARHAPWIVMIDLDSDAECVPAVRTDWVPQATPLLCFRIVVRALEAWLIADREHLARFLSVARSRIPHQPELLPNPKLAMVNLARVSKRADVRADMVPRTGSGRSIGPAYTSRMVEFATKYWDPSVAATGCAGLARTIERLRDLSVVVEATYGG